MSQVYHGKRYHSCVLAHSLSVGVRATAAHPPGSSSHRTLATWSGIRLGEDTCPGSPRQLARPLVSYAAPALGVRSCLHLAAARLARVNRRGHPHPRAHAPARGSVAQTARAAHASNRDLVEQSVWFARSPFTACHAGEPDPLNPAAEAGSASISRAWFSALEFGAQIRLLHEARQGIPDGKQAILTFDCSICRFVVAKAG
jgi:hypothetical protein